MNTDTPTSAIEILQSLLADARELKAMKIEINGDYSDEDLARWEGRLNRAESIILELDPLLPQISHSSMSDSEIGRAAGFDVRPDVASSDLYESPSP